MMDAHNGRLGKDDLIWRGQEKGEEGERLEGSVFACFPSGYLHFSPCRQQLWTNRYRVPCACLPTTAISKVRSAQRQPAPPPTRCSAVRGNSVGMVPPEIKEGPQRVTPREEDTYLQGWSGVCMYDVYGGEIHGGS